MATVLKLKQKRTFETRDKIINTAMELISEQGYFSVTTNEVAKQAGISIGSLYSHFADKKALMVACVEFYYDLVSRDIDASAIKLPTHSTPNFIPYLTGAIESVFLAHQVMPAFHRAMMAACMQEADLRVIQAEKDKEGKQQVLSILESLKSVVKTTNILLAADMVYITVSETVHKYMHGELQYSKENLISELVRMISTYLFDSGSHDSLTQQLPPCLAST
jgi:AcrR family transcriptional regulator